jgi:hypothetical protein
MCVHTALYRARTSTAMERETWKQILGSSEVEKVSWFFENSINGVSSGRTGSKYRPTSGREQD